MISMTDNLNNNYLLLEELHEKLNKITIKEEQLIKDVAELEENQNLSHEWLRNYSLKSRELTACKLQRKRLWIGLERTEIQLDEEERMIKFRNTDPYTITVDQLDQIPLFLIEQLFKNLMKMEYQQYLSSVEKNNNSIANLKGTVLRDHIYRFFKRQLDLPPKKRVIQECFYCHRLTHTINECLLLIAKNERRIKDTNSMKNSHQTKSSNKSPKYKNDKQKQS